MADLRAKVNGDKVIVGKLARVRQSPGVPAYFTDVHKQRIGGVGVVHAVTAVQPRENPLVKLKFEDDAIVFFRLADIEVLT